MDKCRGGLKSARRINIKDLMARLSHALIPTTLKVEFFSGFETGALTRGNCD